MRRSVFSCVLHFRSVTISVKICSHTFVIASCFSYVICVFTKFGLLFHFHLKCLHFNVNRKSSLNQMPYLHRQTQVYIDVVCEIVIRILQFHIVNQKKWHKNKRIAFFVMQVYRCSISKFPFLKYTRVHFILLSTFFSLFGKLNSILLRQRKLQNLIDKKTDMQNIY